MKEMVMGRSPRVAVNIVATASFIRHFTARCRLARPAKTVLALRTQYSPFSTSV
jgi:hypothetical protein